MNGTGDTRLLFRFKNETQNEFYEAIYLLERDTVDMNGMQNPSALSTHFETISNNNNNRNALLTHGNNGSPSS